MESANEATYNQDVEDRPTRSHVNNTADANAAVSQYNKGWIVWHEDLKWHVLDNPKNMGNGWVYDLEHKESSTIKHDVPQNKIQGRYKARNR